jgi:hypothetical protein
MLFSKCTMGEQLKEDEIGGHGRVICMAELRCAYQILGGKP